MSYQVIARKYRPQRFSEVIGQDHVTQTLTNAIQQKRIAHAFLFVGPRGTGKTTIARIFAKCLNCTNGPSVDFPDDDPRCVEITEGRSLDVVEIDGASNRGIDDIRELRETVKYSPAASRFKIYIVDEVHMLTKEAFNALLKTLEEPPAHVKFMFATTEPEKVLPTILSRCQRFDLKRIPVSLIVSHLAEIAAKEKVEVEEAALFAVARAADGGMRDAESILDQLISFCGGKVTEQEVLSMFGLTSRQHVVNLAEAILRNDPAVALQEISELTKAGKDLSRLVSELLLFFRNLLVFKISGGDARVVEVSESEATHLNELGKLPNAQRDSLTRVMEILGESEWRLRESASKKIALEVAVFKAMEAARMVSIDTIIGLLGELKGHGPDAPARTSQPERLPATAPAMAKPPAPAPIQMSVVPVVPAVPQTPKPSISTPVAVTEAVMKETPPQPPSMPGENSSLEEVWEKLMDLMGKTSAFAKTYFQQAHPVSLTRKFLTIGFTAEHSDQMSLVDTPKTHSLLQTQLASLGYPQVGVKFVISAGPAPTTEPLLAIAPEPRQPRPAPAQPVPAVQAPRPQATTAPQPQPSEKAKEKTAPVPFNKDDFKNDPLIQKALEIFKAQIVEVRA